MTHTQNTNVNLFSLGLSTKGIMYEGGIVARRGGYRSTPPSMLPPISDSRPPQASQVFTAVTSNMNMGAYLPLPSLI